MPILIIVIITSLLHTLILIFVFLFFLAGNEAPRHGKDLARLVQRNESWV